MQKLSESLEKKLKYFVAAVLLVIPLYPKFPFLRVPGTYVSIRFEDFIILLLGLILIPIVLINIRYLLRIKVFRAVLLFLFVTFVSLLSAALITKTIDVGLGFLHWIRRVEYMIPLIAGYYAIRNSRTNLAFFLKVIVIVVVIVFTYGFGQKFYNWPVIITQNQEYAKGIALYSVPVGHLTSTFAGHYDMSSFLVLVIPTFIVLFFTGVFTKKNINEKFVYFITILMGLWLVAVSGSRISSLTFLGSATVALFLVKKYKVLIIVWLLGFLVFSTSSNLVARYERLFEVTNIRLKQFRESFVSTSEFFLTKEAYAQVTTPERRERAAPTPTPVPVFEDRSTSIRFNIEWPRAIRALRKNPLLGTGYSSISLATDNDYLRMLGETGLIGFLSFMLIIGEIFLPIIKKIPLNKTYKGVEMAYLAGYLGALCGVLVNAVFIDIFEASKFAIVFWTLTGIALGLVIKDNNEQHNNTT
jgi:hypothetical protein